MKLSTVFVTTLVVTASATRLALNLLSPDVSPQSPVLKEALPDPVQPPPESPTPQPISISIRNPQTSPAPSNDSSSSDDYPSAAAEALALSLHGGFRTTPTSPRTRRAFNTAHGTIMALTFTLYFPAGIILMHTTHNLYIHACIQVFAYANAIVGLGLGIWLGRNVRYLDYAHTVIGMAVVAALVGQVGVGVGAHWRVVRARRGGGERGVGKEEGGVVAGENGAGKGRRWWGRRVFGWGFVHRWLGRCLVALGIINGGLGLQLAQNTKGGEIAYGVVAGVVGTVYLTMLLVRTWRRYRGGKEEAIAPQGGMLA